MARLCQLLGIVAAIFLLTFTPAFAATFNYSSSGSTAIPDGTGSNICGTAVTRFINVTNSFTIGDLNVGLIISHTYKEDLIVSLQSPSGTNATIVNREGGGFLNYNIRLDDSQTTNIQSVDHVTTNPYPEFQRQSLSPLSTFNNENAFGTWTLSVQDCFNIDTGTLLDFYLEFTDTAGVDPLIVTSTADTNTIGTLRYAINHANANAADDLISFNINGLGPHVISPTSTLPTITDDGITIDGSTQGSVVCGGTPNGTGGMSNRQLRIIIFGSNQSGNALTISGASDVTIKGLTIGSSAQSGIYADNADRLTLLCNHLGTSTNSTGSIGNNANGARILNSDNVIIGDGSLEGANIVGFNSGSGIYFPASGPSNSPTIKHNFLGVAADGVSDIGNTGNGLYLAGTSGAMIGGSIGEGNIASGNTSYGIRLTNSDNIDVRGNYLGTSADGLSAIPNLNGLYVTVGSNIRVGDMLSSNRNVISGNTNDGAIFISTSNSQFVGNYVGVDATGNTSLANGWSAVAIQNSTNIAVGGTLSEQSNVITGSTAGSGIYIYGGTSDANVEGNLIGWGANGTTTLGHAHAGIYVDDSQAIIGGETAASKNQIGNNAYSGIVVTGTNSEVAIIGNDITNNTQLGIDLNFNDVTNNDANDTDTGPNNLLNFPLINEIAANGSTSVEYDISLDVPTSSPGYRIDFFKNTATDSTGYGEGELYLGTIDVTGAGNHTGSFTANVAVNTGDNISATTTRKTAGSFDITSEFSLNSSATAQIIASNFLNEDFDDDACGPRPAGWIRSDNLVDEDTSTKDTAPCATSFRSPNRWYQTPTLNLAGETNVELSFFLDMNASSAIDEFYAQYLTSGGSWVTFGTWTNTTQNQRVTAALPAGALYDDVSLRFLTGSSWVSFDDRTYIDTVSVVSVIPASLSVAKTVSPLNAGDYAIPGTDVIYTFAVTNEGEGSVDTDSILLIDSLPPEIIFFNGDYDGPGPSSDIVGFEETDTSLSFDPSVDALFSNGTTKPSNLSECNYTPIAGYDPSVKYVCFNPKGQMLGGDPNPNFNIRFRARIQ